MSVQRADRAVLLDSSSSSDREGLEAEPEPAFEPDKAIGDLCEKQLSANIRGCRIPKAVLAVLHIMSILMPFMWSVIIKQALDDYNSLVYFDGCETEAGSNVPLPQCVSCNANLTRVSGESFSNTNVVAFFIPQPGVRGFTYLMFGLSEGLLMFLVQRRARSFALLKHGVYSSRTRVRSLWLLILWACLLLASVAWTVADQGLRATHVTLGEVPAGALGADGVRRCVRQDPFHPLQVLVATLRSDNPTGRGAAVLSSFYAFIKNLVIGVLPFVPLLGGVYRLVSSQFAPLTFEVIATTEDMGAHISRVVRYKVDVSDLDAAIAVYAVPWRERNPCFNIARCFACCRHCPRPLVAASFGVAYGTESDVTAVLTQLYRQGKMRRISEPWDDE